MWNHLKNWKERDQPKEVGTSSWNKQKGEPGEDKKQTRARFQAGDCDSVGSRGGINIDENGLEM